MKKQVILNGKLIIKDNKLLINLNSLSKQEQNSIIRIHIEKENIKNNKVYRVKNKGKGGK